MAEYIDKAKLMRRLKKLSTEAYQFKFESKMETTINACIDVVDFMPTIGIVNCSECKWLNDNGRGCFIREKTGICRTTFFCADGEVEE